MAIRSVLIDPAAGGVSQVTFDTHTHNYRRVDGVGIDDAASYGSPSRVSMVDDSEVNVGNPKAGKSIGVTVSTQPTATPT